MSDCAYGQTIAQFFDGASVQALPLAIHWDWTWRCDHACVHCYLTDRRQPELSLAEAEGILDQLVEAGTLTLLVSGGDPFLRRDLLPFLKAARARAFEVRLNTHGNAIDAAMADELAELAIRRVSLSVYSPHAPAHDAVTRVSGSHGRTLEAARLLKARGLDVNFKTPIMGHNRLTYLEIPALAASFGATYELDPHLQPDDANTHAPCQLAIPEPERVLAIMADTAPRRAEVRRPEALPDAPAEISPCSAGINLGYIAPDGQLYPCVNWREPMGSLRTHSFRELWFEGEVARRQRKLTRAHYQRDCAGCAYLGKCSFCPGFSYGETGDAARRSAYVCERTHLIMEGLERLAELPADQPVPAPGTPEAAALLARPADAAARRLARTLLPIDEPRR